MKPTEVGMKFKKERINLRASQQEIADMAQIKRSTYANYELGVAQPPHDIHERVMASFAVLRAGKPTIPRVQASESRRIKVYGGISAGDGNTAEFDVDEVDIPAQFAREDYGALVVDGDSMMPFLQPSDIVIFRDWTREKVGHVMAAALPNGDWVVKQLVHDGGQFKLRSLSGRYPDIEAPFKLAGYLVGVVRDQGAERLIRLNPYGILPD